MLTLLFLCEGVGATRVVLLHDSIVDPFGLDFGKGEKTRFATRINGGTYQQYPLSTYRGYQYTTYYNADRHVCIGRRQLPAGAWEVIRFTDYSISNSDSHNVTALGICPADGTVHLAFDHHGKSLHYRVSVPGVATHPGRVVWEPSLFGPVTSELGAVGNIPSVTYPRFVTTPSGNLLLYYRHGGSGSGDGMLQRYSGSTHEWMTQGTGKFIARTGTYDGVLTSHSTSRNPYLNAISYGGGRLHVSWVWREKAGGSQNNHDLCYAYSDDDGRTWKNNLGAAIGASGVSFIDLDSPGLVVAPISQNEGLINQTTHYAFADNRCHVILRHYLTGTKTQRYQHYWRTVDGYWQHEVLPFSPGSRPKLVGLEDGVLFLVYTRAGEIRIAKGVPDVEKDAWDWAVAYVQKDANAGGEGLVDLDRWHQEQILSIYDQEESAFTPDYGNGTAIDAEPAPLHVRDYFVK